MPLRFRYGVTSDSARFERHASSGLVSMEILGIVLESPFSLGTSELEIWLV